MDCSCGTQLLRKGNFQFYLGRWYFFRKKYCILKVILISSPFYFPFISPFSCRNSVRKHGKLGKVGNLCFYFSAKGNKKKNKQNEKTCTVSQLLFNGLHPPSPVEVVTVIKTSDFYTFQLQGTWWW